MDAALFIRVDKEKSLSLEATNGRRSGNGVQGVELVQCKVSDK